jgi:signal transduction histidine kinase/CheY-like chemotaxis protein
MKLGDLFPYTDRNKSLYKMWIRDGFPISSHEVTELLPDFGPKYVENSFIGLTKNELLISFWMIRRDVTISRKLKEESFRVQKLESLGLLAGGIAHDFNNILTGILGSIGLAKLSAAPEDKLFQKLQDAEKGAWRARDLTEQLLTFSRGGAPIKKTTSLGKILNEAVPFALRGSNVKYDLSIPENIMPVEVDEGQINQVIHNLVINADQAMPTGGILSVSAENVYISSEDGLPVSEGAYVVITVKDTGAGIPTEYLEKVFDPYFTTKQKGSGLGLAVSYSIIKGHHGFIRVESDLGRGTSFFIYLPGSDKELNLQSGSAIEELPCTGKILIMDDEAMIRDVALEMLSIKGFEVHCARDGYEAIELYRQAMEQGCRFDAIIMDLTIPGSMGGKETVAELLKMDPTVKAIVSSGYSHDPIMSQYESHGFAGVVTKPYKIENLVNALATVINLAHCKRN